MKTHKDLDVWKQSIAISKDIYQLTKTYPKEEMFGLVSQMRRAAVSIPSNISEGAARWGKKEFVQFLYIALGSASELDTQIEISKITGNGDTSKLDVIQNNIENINRTYPIPKTRLIIVHSSRITAPKAQAQAQHLK